MTQPVFDVQKAGAFFHRCQQEIEWKISPVLAGVLPLVTDRHARFLHHEVPGIQIPASIQQRMSAAGEASVQEGVLLLN